jgi:hypothetical protein
LLAAGLLLPSLATLAPRGLAALLPAALLALRPGLAFAGLL